MNRIHDPCFQRVLSLAAMKPPSLGRPVGMGRDSPFQLGSWHLQFREPRGNWTESTKFLISASGFSPFLYWSSCSPQVAGSLIGPSVVSFLAFCFLSVRDTHKQKEARGQERAEKEERGSRSPKSWIIYCWIIELLVVYTEVEVRKVLSLNI